MMFNDQIISTLQQLINFFYVNRDPIPVPEIERKPLTEVQEFNLHVVNRAVDRAEFDKKVV